MTRYLSGGAAPASVHFVLPADVADPAAPSGGNIYDLRVSAGLAAAGWTVHDIRAGGRWPRPGPGARAELARSLARLPTGSVVLLDGLVACGVPDVIVPHAGRLRLAVLVHLPLADETGLAPDVATHLQECERRTLRAAAAVVATSPWAARELTVRHGLDPARVHVAVPGTDSAPLTGPGSGAPRLLCVAACVPRKGQDLLVEALAAVAELPWECELVGSLDRDRRYSGRLRERIALLGLGDRVRLPGVRTSERLSARYAAADLLLLPSRAETYGMVVTEALAHGTPVLAAAVDAVPDTLGRAPDGSVPGLLVPPGDPHALAAALRRWLSEPALRQSLSASARLRRTALPRWEETTGRLSEVLRLLGQESSFAAGPFLRSVAKRVS